jgi:hypothetical protein
VGVGSPAEGQTRARVKTLDRCVLTPPRYPNGVVSGRAPAPASPARCPSMCGSRCIATSQDGVSGACLARATRAALEAWAEAVEHSLPHALHLSHLQPHHTSTLALPWRSGERGGGHIVQLNPTPAAVPSCAAASASVRAPGGCAGRRWQEERRAGAAWSQARKGDGLEWLRRR